MTCDLCGAATAQFNRHMRQQHPGCRQSSGHMGYRSNGAYVDGWFGGACGTGNPYYLMCAACRAKYQAGARGQAALSSDFGTAAEGGADGESLGGSPATPAISSGLNRQLRGRSSPNSRPGLVSWF